MTDEDIWSVPCHTALMRDRPSVLAIDSETSGLTWKDTAFGVSFAWEVEGELRSGYIDIRYAAELWGSVKEWIKDDKPELLFHNAKFDMHKLGLYPNNFQDTNLMVYLLNEHYPKKLKYLAQKVLGESTDEDEIVKKTRHKLKLKEEDGYDRLPLEVVAPYAIKDAEFTFRLYARLAVKIAEEDEIAEVYSLEKQLILCVAGTEIRGIGINIEYAKERVIALGDEILGLERDIVKIVGKPVGKGEKERVPDGKFKNGNPKFKTVKKNEFNPDSPDQVLAFFISVGINLSGTSKEVLETVSHPLADVLNRIRVVKKDRNTYFVPMVKESEWDAKQGCWVLHPHFNLTKTKTFRSSSSKVTDE